MDFIQYMHMYPERFNFNIVFKFIHVFYGEYFISKQFAYYLE